MGTGVLCTSKKSAARFVLREAEEQWLPGFWEGAIDILPPPIR